MITALKENKDLHSYSASLLYNIPYEDFFLYEDEARTIIKLDAKGDPEYADGMKKLRSNTKSTTFGLLYGMGPSKLADELNITLQEAKDLQALYFQTFPKVKKLMDDLVIELHKNKYAHSPLDGRKMFFYDLDWDHKGKVGHAERQAKNLPFQGKITCICAPFILYYYI